jgi:hypothetical protein
MHKRDAMRDEVIRMPPSPITKCAQRAAPWHGNDPERGVVVCIQPVWA